MPSSERQSCAAVTPQDQVCLTQTLQSLQADSQSEEYATFYPRGKTFKVREKFLKTQEICGFHMKIWKLAFSLCGVSLIL